VATTVRELATIVRGRVIGDDRTPIEAAKPVNEAGPGDITFIDDERYVPMVRSCPASAVLVGPHVPIPEPPERPETMAVIQVDQPRAAFITVFSRLKRTRMAKEVGVDPRACVAPSAQIGEDVTIYPFVYVGEEAVIGDRCVLYPGVVVGPHARLGDDVVLHAQVVVEADVTIGNRVEIHAGAVIGADGFGYQTVDDRHVKIPQQGTVEIGDDCEIGANTAIDRATFGKTVIGEGTKIDNLVQIGHNNEIGRHNILCGQVGIAGSSQTGDHVVMGGQVGLKDHITIGARARLSAQSGLIRDVPAGEAIFGTPGQNAIKDFKQRALVAKLPEMQAQLKALTAEVRRLSEAVGEAASS